MYTRHSKFPFSHWMDVERVQKIVSFKQNLELKPYPSIYLRMQKQLSNKYQVLEGILKVFKKRYVHEKRKENSHKRMHVKPRKPDGIGTMYSLLSK